MKKGTAAACLSIGLILAARLVLAAEVTFENSCRDDVQEKFHQAVTLLHSFEYSETMRFFDEILAEDPGCAMARWGSAMSIWHPLWAPPSEADLETGMKILAATRGAVSRSLAGAPSAGGSEPPHFRQGCGREAGRSRAAATACAISA